MLFRGADNDHHLFLSHHLPLQLLLAIEAPVVFVVVGWDVAKKNSRGDTRHQGSNVHSRP